MDAEQPRPEGYRVSIIGPELVPELTDVAEWLAAHDELLIIERFAEIPESPGEIAGEIIVVLQSWSNQYGPATVNALIEQTLGKHVFCCYGPLCVSDGRTHDIWPLALRIAVDEFRDVFDRELTLMQKSRAPLPPTASGEEVFARRLG